MSGFHRPVAMWHANGHGQLDWPSQLRAVSIALTRRPKRIVSERHHIQYFVDNLGRK
jgi:hypothetical protein